MITSSPLHTVPVSRLRFCVLDLETTGSSPALGARITEIGAVALEAGARTGEFHTLVDPEAPIPAQITALTGIDDATVAGAPRINQVLPAFLDFARGAVLVAHNAPFDLGFLHAAAWSVRRPLPPFATLDTVRLAYRVLETAETANCRLATLADHFGVAVAPTHRALDDARATAELLPRLLERIGPADEVTLGDLRRLCARAPQGLGHRPRPGLGSRPQSRPREKADSRSWVE